MLNIIENYFELPRSAEHCIYCWALHILLSTACAAEHCLALHVLLSTAAHCICCLALLLTTNLQCKALGPRRIRQSSPGLRRTSTGWRCTGRRSDTGTVRTLRISGLKQKIRLDRQSMFRWHGGWEHASHSSGRGFKASCGCSAVVEHLACIQEIVGSNN